MDETYLTSGIDVNSMEELPTDEDNDDVECEILNVTDFQNELFDYEVDIDKVVSFS